MAFGLGNPQIDRRPGDPLQVGGGRYPPRPLAGDAAVRGAKYRAKVEVIEAAQREGHISDDIPADHLLFMLIGLAAWWSSVPQLATFLSGRPAQSEDEISRRRRSVVLAAEQLALRHGR
ncbi:hypothetical protein [Streptomyces sp. CA2R106]|uniref:hypothetical protein n=1 Tax=Streptomyces sp. CA2R106 TaxID=3120153 RepID=UPI003009BC40